jgi:hypothetical protein
MAQRDASPFAEGLRLVSYRADLLDPQLLGLMDWKINLTSGGRTGMVVPRNGAQRPAQRASHRRPRWDARPTHETLDASVYHPDRSSAGAR